jgi:hypothetical protein
MVRLLAVIKGGLGVFCCTCQVYRVTRGFHPRRLVDYNENYHL